MLTLLVVAIFARTLVAALSLGFDVYIRRQYKRAPRPIVSHSLGLLDENGNEWSVMDEYKGHRIVRHNDHFHIVDSLSGDVVEQESILTLEHAFSHVDALVQLNTTAMRGLHGPYYPAS